MASRRCTAISSIYYTNGYDLNVWNDAENEPPRQIFGYHSPDSLEYRVSQRKTRMPAKVLLDSRIADRMYQIEAIKRVIERFGNRYRRSLIVQATGTGKTRVAISLCEALDPLLGWFAGCCSSAIARNWPRRQADQVFQQYLPNEPRIIVRSGMGSGSHTDRIYLATYPAMMQCYQDFDAGYFDLIIADESHRSIYNRYRDLFLYFDAMQVGLTATPVQFISRNTFQLFGCDNQDPTALFRYEDAINHIPPYLVPFRVKTVTTGFLTRGIKYSEMSAEQREELEDQEARAGVDRVRAASGGQGHLQQGHQPQDHQEPHGERHPRRLRVAGRQVHHLREEPRARGHAPVGIRRDVSPVCRSGLSCHR